MLKGEDNCLLAVMDYQFGRRARHFLCAIGRPANWEDVAPGACQTPKAMTAELDRKWKSGDKSASPVRDIKTRRFMKGWKATLKRI